MTGKTIAMLAVTALCGFVILSATPWAKVLPLQLSNQQVAEPAPAAVPELPEGVSLARQCTGSTILSREGTDGKSVFWTTFSRDYFNDMIDQGCMRIARGCNTCFVTYSGCSEEERLACTDGECLSQKCERKVVCSAKHCTAEAEIAPSCDSRLARHTCLTSTFDKQPLDRQASQSE